ncbi:outer membrane lipoprotein carrier protein LolA [Arthrobacter sp. NPDC056886]|uniref:LolA family protein n=1 Tax=Arthrobacter sp. NPDC056886 TaxID=3345960 RepID=UPI00366F7F68
MTRQWLRWLPAVAVPAVIAAGALAGSLPASAGDPLPTKTPEQVLQLIAQHRTPALSGTLEQSSELGLPELPKTGTGPDSSNTAWLELLTGPHTARVYRDGPDNARIQVMDRLAERNAVRHGNEVWFYNSKDNTASHLQLPAHPAGAANHRGDGSDATATPDQLATTLLAKIEPGTDVTVGADVQVAGRAAYNLVLTPKSDATLVGSIAVAVDGQTGLPLGVEIKARGQADPAFRVTYTSLTLGAPDASVFTFSPPPGATVKEIPVQEHKRGKDSGNATAPAAKDSARKPAVTGSGWDSVVEFPARTASPASDAAALLEQATVPVQGGRLLSTALVNVLVLDDGRVVAGSVPLERLQAAAAQK